MPRLPLTAPGSKSDHHGPLWTFATPRVPFNGVSGHPTLGEPVGDPVSEAGGHPRATPLAQPDRLPEPRNIFALGQDRPFVLVDLLNGPAGPFGDLFGGHPGTNHRLHVSWSHPALDLDLQLAQPGAVPTGGGAQRLVEGQGQQKGIAHAAHVVGNHLRIDGNSHASVVSHAEANAPFLTIDHAHQLCGGRRNAARRRKGFEGRWRQTGAGWWA